MNTAAWTGILAFVLVQNVRADRVDDLVESEMNRRKIPGVAIAVVQRGKEIKRAEYGLASVELKSPVTRDTAFEIGSMTCNFTAVAILLLFQDGKLQLDDPVTKYIKSAPSSWNKITLRHLLTHTSGIKSYALQPGFELTKHLTQEQFVELIAAMPKEFSPGEKSDSSISNYALLGFVVENVSGKNFWVFLADRIFTPLRMATSGNREPRLIVANRAAGYDKAKNGALMNRDSDLTDMFAAGAMISSVGDLLKWDAALDSEQILTSENKMTMWTPAKLNNGDATKNGFGCRIETYKIYISLTHTGSAGGFNACYLKFPETAFSVVVCCNLGEAATASTIARAIAGHYLDQE